MSSDLTVTGINNAQKLMIDSAIRIAHYIKEHPVPPKDFEIKGALSSSTTTEADTRNSPPPIAPLTQAQTLAKNRASLNTGTDDETDPTRLLPKPIPLPKPPEAKPQSDDTAGESHPSNFFDPLTKQVEQANNVILFFKGRQEVLSSKAKSKAEEDAIGGSGFFADLRA
jgi:hypothetical protein